MGRFRLKAAPCITAACAAAVLLLLYLGSGSWVPVLTCAAVGLSQRGEAVVVQATAPTAADNGTTVPFGSADSQEVPTTAATTTAAVTGKVAGKVVETVLPVGSSFVQGVAIRNRSGTALDLETELAAPVGLTLAAGDAPQVLIYHTHTTESYMPYFNGTYREGEAARTTDESINVCAVGEAIAVQLRQAGIGVIHDTTIHDKPQYTGAYSRSEATVQAILEANPTISVVIDVHRDGVMIDETTKSKPTVVINGRKAAQLMIICGAASTESIPSPHWRTNLRLSLQVQQNLAQQYGQLIRQMSVVSSRYNQHLGKAAFLVEVGSEGNTLEEALYAGELFGRALGEELNALR